MESISHHEIAGIHLPVYEKYLQEVNPTSSDVIKALDAATFLRKSGLNQLTLKTIWDLSDPSCLGYLDKKSFFISLKLIAMVQNGKALNINDVKAPLPPPIISEDVLSSIDWSISRENVDNYTKIYNSLIPIDGKLAGSKVKPYMMNSKLPVDILTKVWDLSDIDQDGFLNMKEFILSCHLIAKAAQGLVLPPQLPPELLNFNPLETPAQQPNSKPSPISSSPQSFISEASNSNAISQWVVSAEDKAIYEDNFVKLDKDNDGLVNGFDVKDTLLQSGLAQNVLAHIWNLCDIKGSGMLNSEQFALANYFIKQKQNGLELPLQLAPHMIPPTLRQKPSESTSTENVNGSQTSTGNKELDSITEEIKQLQLEKVKYESEVTSEEASLRLKQSEIKNIQNEIETLSQMLKQLENQKNDASRRLDDLNSQVDNLNQQYLDQKKKIDDQEGDLGSKRKEFEDLKNEEVRLESKLTLSKNEAEQASKNATDTQLEISQIRANCVELEEYERRVNEMISDYDHAINNQDIVKIASLLPRSITPPPFVALESQTIDEFNVSKAEFNADPFAGEDPFKDDPFNSGKAADAFGSDNFANFDAFGNGIGSKASNDPFGFSAFSEASSAGNSGDAFRSESPTPALPPKKSKAPPPRPAPPKSSNKTPLRAAPPPPVKDQSQVAAFSSNFDPFNDNRDPFGSDSFSSQNFANFANFDKA